MVRGIGKTKIKKNAMENKNEKIRNV